MRDAILVLREKIRHIETDLAFNKGEASKNYEKMQYHQQQWDAKGKSIVRLTAKLEELHDAIRILEREDNNNG